jgi:hypothetical protein
MACIHTCIEWLQHYNRQTEADEVTDSNDMARGAKGIVLHGSTLRSHKCKATEFYARRQKLSHPIIMNIYLGLWDISDFCFMFSYVRTTA